jgi:cell division protein FtsA
MMKDLKNLIVALDIGTSKVVALVAEILPDGSHRVLGLGQYDPTGLKRDSVKKGVIVNIDATVEAIQHAIEEAELMADCKIRHVYAGIAGNHIRSFNSHGMVAIKGKEVSSADVLRVLDTARAINIQTGKQLLHTVSQEYRVDSQDGIRDPIGMSGMRLEVKVHIVTGDASAVDNLLKCIRRCGLEVAGLILQPMASADAVLTEDEKELGVTLIDIGGGTTDVAIFINGAIRHTAVIPIAGDYITSDIAKILQTPTQEAEEIKQRYGIAKQTLADPGETIEVVGIGNRKTRPLSRQMLAAIIEPRVEELFEQVLHVMNASGYGELLSSGVVLTGGAAMMQGMTELAEEIFLKPVRVGYPQYTGNLADIVQSSRYATAHGLLLEARRQYARGITNVGQQGKIQSLWEKATTWFISNF